MRKPTAFVIAFGMVFMLTLSTSVVLTAVPREPVLLIIDTDMGNDVDDAMALAVIHALETRGHSRLLAVTLTKDHPLAAEFVDAINTFYGRGDIPIGRLGAGWSDSCGISAAPLSEPDSTWKGRGS